MFFLSPRDQGAAVGPGRQTFILLFPLYIPVIYISQLYHLSLYYFRFFSQEMVIPSPLESSKKVKPLQISTDSSLHISFIKQTVITREGEYIMSVLMHVHFFLLCKSFIILCLKKPINLPVKGRLLLVGSVL